MLYKETVEPATMGLLNNLMQLEELQQFRLVGETALSLLLGHRNSIDLDLFTDEPFDFDSINDILKKSFPTFSSKEKKSPRLLFATINNVKVDFVHTFERFNHDPYITENIRFASLPEIIALKLNAIAGRGAKKDFWDLHELLNQFSFEKMINFYREHYPQNSDMMIIKSIPYFAEAEKELDPYSYKGVKWEQVKKEIVKKFNQYIDSKNKN